MIYIVHGDDYPKSRKLIINQQKKLAMGLKTERDVSDITPKELYEIACSFDIFGNAPFYSPKNSKLESCGSGYLYRRYEKNSCRNCFNCSL